MIPRLRVKSGVDMDGLHQAIVHAILAALVIAYTQDMHEVWITSARRVRKRPTSLHPDGEAIDLRRWNMPDAEHFRTLLAGQLGPAYDVVLEHDHMHVEYDPANEPKATTIT